MVLLEALYVLCALLPSLYAFNSLVLTWLYLRRRWHPRRLPTRAQENGDATRACYSSSFAPCCFQL